MEATIVLQERRGKLVLKKVSERSFDGKWTFAATSGRNGKTLGFDGGFLRRRESEIFRNV